jgi:hypothetical protein
VYTSESLTSSDTDANTDIYERSSGTTTQLSVGATGGNGPYDVTYRGQTDDGGRVFFRTAEALTSYDSDLVMDVYASDVPGQVIVVKDSVPNDAQDFDFTLGGGLSLGLMGPPGYTFQLDDDSDPALSNSQTITNVAPGAGYSVTETVPSGWDQTGATCSDGSPVGNINVSSGETVTCTFVHRALGPRPAAAATRLAAQYAPQLRLAAGERYRPLRLEDYLSDAVLRTGSPPHGVLTQSQRTLFTLPVTTTATYLDVRDAEPYLHAGRYPGLEHALELARPRPTIYFHLAYQPAEQRVAIEYWFLYLYNDFYGKHEADWEGVTVFLRNSTPLGATYSQHQGRKWIPWSALATSGGHAVVYVARGSHADYPKPGSYSVRVCWSLHGRHCAPTPRVDSAAGDGTSLGPGSYDLQPFGGTGYSGGWGSGNYVLGVGLTRDRIGDPRRRAEYTNPFAAVPG